MKKFNAILDDTTIINFVFFARLLKRYILLTTVIPIFIFGYAAYYYSTQNIVYIKNINFTFKKDDSSSPSSAIATLVGEKSSELTESDIIAISKSPDFRDTISNLLMADPNTQKITLSGLKAQIIKMTPEQFSFCNNNQECFKNAISERISGFYSLKSSDIIDKMMKLEVKTLTPFSSSVLLDNIKQSFIKFRLNQIKHSITEQKKISLKLINQKKTELIDIGYESSLKKVAQGKAALRSLVASILSLEHIAQKQKMSAEVIQTQYEQTKKIGNKNIDSDIDSLEHLAQLKKEISNLKADINALKLSQSSFTNTDKNIIKKLQKDLRVKNRKYKRLRKNTNLTSNDSNFISSKSRQSKSLEFEYKISKKQMSKTVAELERLIVKRDNVISQNEIDEITLAKGKPTSEYITLLENKLMQLKILDSTMISDIIFDKKASGIRAFRRTTKLKVAMFATLVTLFTLFLVTLIRYMLDPRIYDEYELQKTFEDLDVIGKTPDFNS